MLIKKIVAIQQLLHVASAPILISRNLYGARNIAHCKMAKKDFEKL